ncbi:ParD-like family protein [Rhodococcus aerolatus]
MSPMTTMPTRVDGDLFAAAKSSGAVHSRSAAQQLAHWARIGRELEASTGVSHRDVEAVLAGDRAYDALGEREQAVVRGAWDERVAERLAGLDLTATLAADGLAWAEADEDGALVTHGGTTDQQ